MVRVTKDLFPPRRRKTDCRPALWTSFWFLLAVFLLGFLYSKPDVKSKPDPVLPFPFDPAGIYLNGPNP